MIEVIRLVGGDWQNWADQILSRHYGPTEYQKIPARDGGDAGLEGFTLTSGHAFQCYGCEEPISLDDRFCHQRDKMTADIGKFIKNKPKLVSLLGATLIRRWCLFVPVCDSKRLIVHANRKTDEVMAAGLPYVAPDFRVVVAEEKDFPKERDELLNLRPCSIDVAYDPVSQDQLDGWAGGNDPLITSLDGKIARLPTIKDHSHRLAFRNQMLRHFLDGQNVLEALRKSYPTAYNRAVRAKYGKERFLATASMVATGNASENLMSAVEAMQAALADRGCGVTSETAEAIAYEAVADWLLRCPLDFPELDKP